MQVIVVVVLAAFLSGNKTVTHKQLVDDIPVTNYVPTWQDYPRDENLANHLSREVVYDVPSFYSGPAALNN